MGQGSTTIEFIFWLHNASKVNATSDLIKCRISPTTIILETAPNVIIPLNSISQCRVEYIGSAAPSRVRVELKETDEIFYFGVANPLDPRPLPRLGSETDAFVDVVNNFLVGKYSSLNVNPYLREFAHRNIVPLPKEDLNPDISPTVYFNRYNKPPTIRNKMMSVIGLSLLLLLFFVLLAALFGGIQITF